MFNFTIENTKNYPKALTASNVLNNFIAFRLKEPAHCENVEMPSCISN